MELKKKTSSSSSSSMNPDWSYLPHELLHIISKNLEEDCFSVIHSRSVCTLWRSIFPFPSSLLRPSYSLPTFSDENSDNEGSCTLEKVPLFFFRVKTPLVTPLTSTSKYFLGKISRDEFEELSSSIECSIKVNIAGSEPTTMNVVDCQILPLGYQYRIIGWEPKDYRGVAFLPLNKEGEEEAFVVLVNYSNVLLVLKSSEMKWKRLENVPEALSSDIVAFKGKFYAAFLMKMIFVIDPYSLEVTLQTPSPRNSLYYLVPFGNDELFLVEVIIPAFQVIDFNRFACRVSKLDDETSKWVEVCDLGDCVLFIGRFGNVCCSAKELPDGCGMTGNSIVFIDREDNVTFFYKYRRSNEEIDSKWRVSTENYVEILNTTPFVALKVEQ